MAHNITVGREAPEDECPSGWSYSDESLLTYRTSNFVWGLNKGVAGFDLDGTLVDTESGKKFPDSANDWCVIEYPGNNMLDVLFRTSKNANLVIITNQAGKNKELIKERLRQIVEHLCWTELEFILFCALEKDKYRKPHTTIWDEFLSTHADKDSSFFVGDAAGRKGDHSCVDRAFAANIGIKFFTPENYVKGGTDKEEFEWDFIYNRAGFTNVAPGEAPRDRPYQPSLPVDKTDVVILIGYPGSGKSSWAKRNIPEHVLVSADVQKTRAPKVCEAALKEGKSVVIDNTNPDEKAREPYVSLANKYGAKIMYIYFDIDINLAKHLNWVRESKGDRKRVPDISYNVFKKRLALPAEYIKVYFEPVFESDADKKYFYQYSEI